MIREGGAELSLVSRFDPFRSVNVSKITAQSVRASTSDRVRTRQLFFATCAGKDRSFSPPRCFRSASARQTSRPTSRFSWRSGTSDLSLRVACPGSAYWNQETITRPAWTHCTMRCLRRRPTYVTLQRCYVYDLDALAVGCGAESGPDKWEDRAVME